MPVIALIADVIRSRDLPRRAAVQRRLQEALMEVSAKNPALASPYTLTLGDEFQAVYRAADPIFADILALMATLHPVRIRFALGVGELSTAINPRQALAMDGPAFHQARAALDELKRSGGVWKIGTRSAESWALLNHALAFVGHHLATWDRNRLAILRYRLLGVPVAEMVEAVGISKVAIHKNIRVAALDDVAAICQEVTTALRRSLGSA